MMRHRFFWSILAITIIGMSPLATYGNSCCINECNECCTNACTQICDDSCELNESCCCDDVFCKSHFSARSQGLDTARWLAGRATHPYKFETDELYGELNIVAAFTRSFNPEKIGKYFIPATVTPVTDDTCQTTCCTTCYTPCTDKTCCGYKSTCSACADETCTSCSCTCHCLAMGADQTGTTEPTVDIRSADFGTTSDGTVCLNPRVSNFIVDFNLFVGLNDFINGLFAEIHAPVVHSWWDTNCCSCEIESSSCPTATFNAGDMAEDVTFVGTTNLKKALKGDITWGDVKNELCFGQICAGRQSKTRLADLRLALGYNLFSREKFRWGIKAIVAAPTGNRPKAYYMFEPIIGNGGHWEVGAGTSCDFSFWSDKEDNHAFGVYAEGYISHMLKSRWHYRTFDLTNNGCFSRYLLLKKFDGNGTYVGLERGPNVFTQRTKVQIDVQGDASAMLRYRYKKWSFDVGYNFWGRSREKIKDMCCCIPDSLYGIKGIVNVYDGDAVNNKTASTSTIRTSSGTAGANDGDTPVYVACADLNPCSAAHPSAYSHAVFFNMSAAWDNEDDINPTFGIGGKVEWSGKGNRALDQWSLWAKGGISF